MSFVGYVVMALAILLSIVAHEYGHYKTAKLFGMKVTQFFVGFGNTIWSRTKGETEYGIKALPLGGFVRIVGQTPLEEVDPADEPRAMYRQPLGRKAIVMSAGSGMHFIIAIVLGVIVFAGFHQFRTDTSVSSVSQCFTPDKDGICATGAAGVADKTPAAIVGLLKGDKILAVDGVPTPDWGSLHTEIIKHHDGDVVPLEVKRGDSVITLHPIAMQPPVAKGVAADPNRNVVIGFVPGSTGYREAPLTAIHSDASFFWQSVSGTFSALYHLPSKLPAIIHPKKDNSSGVIGLVGATQVGGDALKHGDIAFFLLILASLNISIGVFNLLPILPLDGGHLAIMFFERARSGISRRLHRPDPGRVDMLKLLPVTVAVIGFLGVLSVLIVVGDLVHPAA